MIVQTNGDAVESGLLVDKLRAQCGSREVCVPV